ncbi:MAG: bifunctional proline dehydrogenase/L-glutamate gamma-semialdehyde dehydrogenase PutA [Henriciella sp.]
MPFSHPHSDALFKRLTDTYLADESSLTAELAQTTILPQQDRAAIDQHARQLTEGLLEDAKSLSAVDAFLEEYSLSSDEGTLLMRLAESLIRTPDARTGALLIRDKLISGNWAQHMSARHPLVTLGSLGLSAAKAWTLTSGGVNANSLLARLGDRVMLSAVRSAIALLGRHFVLGTSISRATKRGRKLSTYGATYSFDMLGEAALTAADAARYFQAYKRALLYLAETSDKLCPLHQSPALSIKLSALHPRYEYAQRERCVPELTARLMELCEIAKTANIGLTIDAEEVDRLEVSLLVFERLLAADPGAEWSGLGLAVQAYQRRAIPALQWVYDAAKSHDRKITIRLVKGAYWDSEIKRAQELGLTDYPVFTRKEHTDISYLASAKFLLACTDHIYPQFATHNAHTAAAVLQMAGPQRNFEFQRLHGMSDGLHRRLAETRGVATRTYAPVGRHKDLLPYLVRRLLENGANSSFVNQLLDTDGAIDTLVEDPVERAQRHNFSPHPRLRPPRHRGGDTDCVAAGEDMTQSDVSARLEQDCALETLEANSSATAETMAVISPNDHSKLVGRIALSTAADISRAAERGSQSPWPDLPAPDRAKVLRRAADLFERDRADLMQLCVSEAGKTWPDAEAELREAVDFLRYYAGQAEEPDIAARSPLGPIACISPWNFPLAIFLGQVSAALSVGNTVLAKPAEQTPLIAHRAIKLLYEAGVPEDAVTLIIGDGKIGAALTAHPGIAGVCFTGSTPTAKLIAKALVQTGTGDRPLIAETGGINAMIIDSTALPEQAVKDVIRSAFQSAGQRCSASRLVCVQDDIADAFITMLAGAMQELETGHPAALSTDLGPIIDDASRDRIALHTQKMKDRYKLIGQAPPPLTKDGAYLAPVAFEIDAISDLQDEVFGPVLHLVRFRGSEIKSVIEEINQLGFGLTMGLHTRIDARADEVSEIAKVGNLYINRDQIGAIVGEQPFGGEGLSGTGPKAGGPNYLKRLSKAETASLDKEMPAARALPGPTGEANSMAYRPRGVLLCVGGEDGALAAQVARVKETGNTAETLDGASLQDALLRTDIAGIVADGDIRSDIARLLAQRPGAILPLLSAKDETYRFVLERVVSVDMTAAGGNATLLASI